MQPSIERMPAEVQHHDMLSFPMGPVGALLRSLLARRPAAGPPASSGTRTSHRGAEPAVQEQRDMHRGHAGIDEVGFGAKGVEQQGAEGGHRGDAHLHPPGAPAAASERAQLGRLS